MPDDPYSLSDLARLADVTPRTIRYYVAQGLLPSPEAAGPATRYGEGHLLRLRLIKRLQRDHLPLAEIRGRLERMEDEEVASMLDSSSPQPTPPPAETLAFVRGLMNRSGIEPRTAASGGHSLMRRVESTFAPRTPESFPLRSEPAPPPATASPGPLTPARPPSQDTPETPSIPPTPSTPATPAYAPPAPSAPVAPGSRSTAGDRSTWERLAITPDVELHVRRPLDRHSNKKVEQLARIARELFDEEP